MKPQANEWEIWFAWHPVIMVCGNTAWWKPIERRWSESLGVATTDFTGYSYVPGGYEYRITQPKSTP